MYAPADSVVSKGPTISERQLATLGHMDKDQTSSPEKRRRGKGFTVGATAVGALMVLSPTARDIASETLVNMYESLTDTADSNSVEKTDVVALPGNHGDLVVEVTVPPVPTALAP